MENPIKKDTTRDNVVSVKLSDAEAELMDNIAFYYSITRSDLIRYWLSKEAQELKFELPARLKYETT